MDADERGSQPSGTKRIRLSTLLVLFPTLALVAVLVAWVVMLRQQVASLEQRVITLETTRPVALVKRASHVGIPDEVDRAMLMDGIQGNPSMPMMTPRY